MPSPDSPADPAGSDPYMARAYYDDFAATYDETRQQLPVEARAELASMRHSLVVEMKDRSVLELACGTGYWTAAVSAVARWVTALDYSPAMLAVARQQLPPIATHRVHLVRANVLEPPLTRRHFNGALAAFWLSHVRRADLPRFLSRLHEHLQPDSRIVLLDSVWRPEFESGTHTIPGSAADTYRQRSLASGRTYEVLKNYYRRDELLSEISAFTTEFTIDYGAWFWFVSYVVR